MDLRPFYFDALDNTNRIVKGVDSAHLGDATPCEGWDVRALLNHVVGGLWMFAGALGGEDMTGRTSDRDLLGDDPAGAFDAARAAALDAWNADGALDRTVTITAGQMPSTVALRVALMEAVVHGWDLAKATGQDHGINPMVAAAMLDGMRKAVTDDQRGPGKFFDPEVKVPEDAPIEEQLVAFLGRTP